jgi:His-Xaa-Ser system radical SAM maturase HxsC
MIPLSHYGRAHEIQSPIVGKILSSPEPGWASRINALPKWDESVNLDGYQALLCEQPLPDGAINRLPVPTIDAVSLAHLAEGDVVSLDQRGHVRTLYRRNSPHNALFATDRCNSLCLMCSQPPRVVNDDWRVREMLDVIALIDRDTRELGISGGEPTLLKDGFVKVVEACRDQLPATSLHVLSNGRLFRYGSLARRVGEIRHSDLMIGVPVYSDLDDRHDYVVQAKGAFEETLVGLQNLGRFGVPVEIRVVVHSLTYDRLPQLAEFIYRNLAFASHVTFMGLEMMGFAISNLDLLWIDPWDYQNHLEAAVLSLAERGMNVSVYNHQLCTVPQSVWPYCRKSISDWKNEYLKDCDGCMVRSDCGGFFSSAVARKRSEHIRPLVCAGVNDALVRHDAIVSAEPKTEPSRVDQHTQQRGEFR